MYIYIYTHTYIHTYIVDNSNNSNSNSNSNSNNSTTLIELRFLLSKLDKWFPVEHFEATVSQSAVPAPLLFSIIIVSL